MESKTKRKRSRNGKAGVTINLLLIAAAIGSLGFFAIGQLPEDETIHAGIHIDGVSVAGMEKAEAVRTIQQQNAERLNNFKLVLEHEGAEWLYEADDVGLSTNVDEVVDEAYQLGRQGNVFNRFRRVRQLKKDPVQLRTRLTANAQRVENLLANVAQEVEQAPVDAALLFKPDAEIKFEITPEEWGYQLNTDTVKAHLVQELAKDNNDIQLTLEPERIRPQVLKEDFSGKTEKLITFGTDLSFSSQDRTHNVRLAAEKFNGLMLVPGEVASFNQTTGERTLETGYRNAPMIAADKSLVDVPGGGVSQTSSTLYNAALLAGLEIVEFVRHSFPSVYIDKGRDTTVNLPAPVIDLKIRNNKTSPVYLRTFYANQQIYFEFYGEPLPGGREVRLRTEEYETISAPEPRYVPDTSGEFVQYEDEEYEQVRSRDGYKVRVYREIYQGNERIESKLLDDHYYRPIQGVIYTGVDKRPEEERPLNTNGGDIVMEVVEILQ